MTTRQVDGGTVTTLVAEAAAAPSMHNAQPWRFRLLADRGTLLLRGDLDRAMRRTDPGHRALHIGCGAALFNLRVAAAHAGLAPRVRLLPDPGDPLLLAAVQLTGAAHGADRTRESGGGDGGSRGRVDGGGGLDGREGRADDGRGGADDLRRLHPAIAHRHTSRYPFAEREVPQEIRTVLQDAARREGADLLHPGPWHTEAVLELIHDAERRDDLDPLATEDLVRWTRLGPEADVATDGVPEYAFGPRRSDGKAPLRDFAGRRPVADRGATAFEHDPCLALLSTEGDTPTDWLVAGQALERVLLEATLAGLATSLTSHPLERADLRLLARDPVVGRGHVQMVLRLGYGPSGPATPRRPVREILDIA